MTEKHKNNRIIPVESAIITLRGQKVILDTDLARIYGIPTFRLNEAIKRNRDRFPEDFLYQLTLQEVDGLTSQIAISKTGRGGRRTLPYAFTEHGAIMAATVLNSPQAVQMSIFIVRAFIKMREQLLNRAELETRLADIEKTLMSHNTALRDLYQKIRPLLLPPPELPRKQIGFHACQSEASLAASEADVKAGRVRRGSAATLMAELRKEV
ncbi:MAG: ORF6N domain-containing protein [Kiritimatiellia bacterium]